MLSRDEVQQVIGCTAYGSDRKKIGTVGEVYRTTRLASRSGRL